MMIRNIFCVMGLLSFLFGGCSKEQPNVPSDATVQSMPPGQISYSQVDITESFGDDERLKPEDWIATVPLNKMNTNGPANGLPPVDASDEDVYKAAEKLSRMRESVSIPSDGVYCPVCHIANTQLSKLRTPCPKCGRALLKFGWD